jgi:hypothetical protein
MPPFAVVGGKRGNILFASSLNLMIEEYVQHQLFKAKQER